VNELPEFRSIVMLLALFVVTFILANGAARLAGYKE
jgi:hypothetical protein